MQLHLFEENKEHHLLPLTYFKHIAELRVGCFSIAEKWEKLGVQTVFSGRNYLGSTVESTASLWVNGAVIPSKELLTKTEKLPSGAALTCNNSIIAFRGDSDFRDASGYLDTKRVAGFNTEEIKCEKLTFPWDIVRLNPQAISNDAAQFYNDLLSNENIYVSAEATVHPSAVLNASEGPIIIEKNAIIEPFVYLKGPCFIGKRSVVKSHSTVTNSSIHHDCRISGEISTSVQLEYSNKGHDGFMGQSILGSWTNLGAGTTTSNLKNNYSNVNVDFFGSRHDLDMQFLGLIMGDHSKCAIGTLFNTATIVGACSNIFGTGMPSKYVPSFTWGNSASAPKAQLEKIMETAERVMPRRNVAFTEKVRAVFTAAAALAAEVERAN